MSEGARLGWRDDLHVRAILWEVMARAEMLCISGATCTSVASVADVVVVRGGCGSWPGRGGCQRGSWERAASNGIGAGSGRGRDRRERVGYCGRRGRRADGVLAANGIHARRGRARVRAVQCSVWLGQNKIHYA